MDHNRKHKKTVYAVERLDSMYYGTDDAEFHWYEIDSFFDEDDANDLYYDQQNINGHDTYFRVVEKRVLKFA